MDKAGMTLKILLIFTLFLISGGGESETVTGYSGGGVLIKCKYETQYTSNPKYLCEGSWPCMTKPIWTDAKNEWINRGRFSLFDDTRAAQFWVVIRELTVEDSGMYKCGVYKSGIDVYTPVELKVEEDQNYAKSVSVTGHEGGSVNISCKYVQSHSSDPKFLCRMMGSAGCTYKTSVNESRRWINAGKLSLHDDRAKQIFTVSFNRLTEGDSGEYWCGTESDWTSDHGYKVFITQINLRVTGPDVLPQSSTPISSSTTQPTTSSPPETTSSPLSTTGSPPPAFPVSSVVTGVSVAVLLLLIGLLFFIVTLRKRNKTQGPASIQSQSHRGSSDNHTDKEVKDIPVSDAGASTVYSAVELLTNPSEPSQTVYDNVQLSTNPSEPSQTLYGNVQLSTNPSEPSQAVSTYATVNFSKNADSSTDAVPTATINKENDSCDYATVKLGGGESERVMGYSGGGVLIKCKYETQYRSNEKYLCKGSWPGLTCTDQITTGVKNEWINRGRFSLFDDARGAQFWVVIRELTVEDSGTYKCGVEISWKKDVYTPVELKVEEDPDYKKSISVTGHVGGSVIISCKYPQSHSSVPKFLCRMMGTGGCTYKSSVNESRRWRNEGKLSLHDDRARQIFTVSFNSLTEGDSGEYWCGAESDWTSDHGYKAYITQINLRVTGSPPPAFPVSSVVTGVSVAVLLLLIGLLFFIVTLRKRNKTQGPASIQSQSHRGSSDNHTVSRDVYVYEEVKDIPVSDAGAFTVYSTADLPTNPSEPSQTLYGNVQLSTNPSEPSQTVSTYTTVNFSKNADSSTDAVPTATINKENDSCDYATVKC
ncbi:hypothetical protein SRHO_G00178440 [Serrasalmus rhombeus]